MSTSIRTLLTPTSPTRHTLPFYILKLMHRMYPRYGWAHQDDRIRPVRGLDLIGTRLGGPEPAPNKIGVQVNPHDPTQAPSDEEWCRFLAGCFTCRVDLGIFVTTGGLLSEQRCDAAAAGVIVIAGIQEITRVAVQYGCVSPERAGTDL